MEHSTDDALTTEGQATGGLPAEAVRTGRGSLAQADRLHEISDRLGADVEDLLAALTTLAHHTPPTGEPAASLSEPEEAVLREAGSLAEQTPPLAASASAATTVGALRVLADALTVKQAAHRLGVSEGRVRQRLTARTLLGIETGSGWRLPAFQFTASGDVRGIDQVLPALPRDVHPLVVQHFLTRPNPDLVVDGEPVAAREWLDGGGQVSAVVELARGLHSLP